MASTPTKTPFNLTYSIEATIPMEVEVTNMRREFFNEEGNGDQLKMNLDCLHELRTEASQRIAKYQQKMVSYYNQRLKLTKFNIGDLVLRKVTLATKDPT